MKRVIALSDSHGDKAALRAAVEQALRVGPVYAAAFLGDGLSDFAAVQPLLMEAGALCHAVRGNNDWGSREELAAHGADAIVDTVGELQELLGLGTSD